MKSKRFFLSVLSTILVAGCGMFSPTTYSPNPHAWPHLYGYEDAPIDANTYEVTFSGNTATRPEVVDRYALYRAAELTVEKGFDYFIVLDAQHNAITSTSNTMGTNETHIEHDLDPMTGKMIPVAVSTNQPMTSTTTAEHTVTKTIRMYHGNKPDSNAAAYDARSMVKVMAPRIERGE